MPTTSTSFVVILGIATVFIGLIGLIILCKILGAICKLSDKEETKPDTVATITDTPVQNVNPVIENKQEIIAAVSAALAEELGTDIQAIRILSFKKI